MKRLLAYLFIVLGLGIYFNDHAQAKNYCIPKKVEYVFQSIYIFKDCYVYHKKVDLDTFVEFALTHPLQTVGVEKESPLFMEENLKWLKKYLKENNISSSKINKSINSVKISKKKSGQAQKVADGKTEDLYVERMVTKKEKQDFAKGKIKIYRCSTSTGTHLSKGDCFGDYYKKELLKKDNLAFLNLYLLKDYTKTQIAKAEPSQTQTSNANSSIYKFCDNGTISIKCYTAETSLKNFLNEKLSGKNDSDPDGSLAENIIFERELNRVLTEFKLYNLNTNTLFKTISEMSKFDKFEKITNRIKTTQIAKAEPSLTQKVAKTEEPKEKVKVAKVEEIKQEEFKPENKDIDNDAPVIEIAQNIIVDSQTYTLKGKVKDKSKLYLEANGRPLKISKRGNFELEGFVVDPDAGDKIKIVAIDQWKNKSEKTINIKVEFKEIAELRSYEKPNPSKIKVKQDKNKIAIIIGIEKYKTLKNIDAPYANRDANAFRAYANRALGIPNKNIKVLIDENATRGETLKALTLWLPQIARGKNKDIYVFFAGHGLASDDGKNLYILPQDGDATLLQYTALSRLEIFDLINRVEPNSVTMFFDTCYSGQTRDERMLVAGLRPIRLVAEEQEVQNNFTIFTASNYDQTSGSIEEAKHGIFSYYLMMGMQGKADSNQDKKITNGELIAYLKQNVSEEAFINNRQQEPMLSGDPDKVLISYR